MTVLMTTPSSRMKYRMASETVPVVATKAVDPPHKKRIVGPQEINSLLTLGLLSAAARDSAGCKRGPASAGPRSELIQTQGRHDTDLLHSRERFCPLSR